MTGTCTAWNRSAKSDHEDEGASDTLPLALASRVGESRSHEVLPSRGTGTAASTVLRQKRMSFKAAGQATLGFLSARRRLEDGLKCFSKRRQSRRESLCGDSEFSMSIYILMHRMLFSMLTNDLKAKLAVKCTRGQSNLTKSASRGPIPRLGVTPGPGGRKLYH